MLMIYYFLVVFVPNEHIACRHNKGEAIILHAMASLLEQMNVRLFNWLEKAQETILEVESANDQSNDPQRSANKKDEKQSACFVVYP